MSSEHARLEMKLLYSIIVAGKSARFANDKVQLLVPLPTRERPLSWLVELDEKPGALRAHLEDVRTGRYEVLLKAVRWLGARQLDLSKATQQELEECPGVGPKTSRFFMTWSRPDQQVAVLDVHVLRWLRSQGYDAPSSTPPAGDLYDELERCFLLEAELHGVTPRELDLAIWRAASTAPNVVPPANSGGERV